MQYLSIRIRKNKEVMKVNKKASSLILKTVYLFLKTLTAGLINFLNKY